MVQYYYYIHNSLVKNGHWREAVLGSGREERGKREQITQSVPLSLELHPGILRELFKHIEATLYNGKKVEQIHLTVYQVGR